MPKISVIIPTYNSSSTISKSVQSLLEQTYTDFEVIIMDGCSTDATVDMINSYNDTRIKIFVEKDKGVYDAMNKGILKVSGEWLYFLGSDDFLYDNNVFQNIVYLINNSDNDIIYGDAFFLKSQLRHDGEFNRKKIFQKTNICHQAIFYKRNLFQRLGNYNLDFPLYADWDFNIRCFSTPDLKIKYINLIIVYYNDFSGISNSGIYDKKFHEISGYELVNKIDILENSTELFIGKLVLSPFKFIKRTIKRIINLWSQ